MRTKSFISRDDKNKLLIQAYGKKSNRRQYMQVNCLKAMKYLEAWKVRYT